MGTEIADVFSFHLLPFLIATFAGALIASICGFAFGLVASAIWLHFITPAQSAPLIAAFAIVIQAWSVWKLRRSVEARLVLPLLAGGMLGIPLGTAALQWLPAWQIHVFIGIVCIAFGIYGLAQPKLPPIQGGALSDMLVGFASGFLGGSTGLGGIPTTMWTSLRGWPKDKQRAVFQPVTLALFVLTLTWFANKGVITSGTACLFLAGLPPVLAGSWIGWKLYGRLDDAAFRKALLILLLVSGSMLALSVR
jgi:uncharacterized membrane protein YfcA